MEKAQEYTRRTVSIIHDQLMLCFKLQTSPCMPPFASPRRRRLRDAG